MSDLFRTLHFLSITTVAVCRSGPRHEHKRQPILRGGSGSLQPFVDSDLCDRIGRQPLRQPAADAVAAAASATGSRAFTGSQVHRERPALHLLSTSLEQLVPGWLPIRTMCAYRTPSLAASRSSSSMLSTWVSRPVLLYPEALTDGEQYTFSSLTEASSLYSCPKGLALTGSSG